MHAKALLIFVFWLALLDTTAHAREPLVRFRSQFQAWYEQFGPVFQQIFDESCQDEYRNYLYGTPANTTADAFTGGDDNNKYIQPVV